MSDLRLPPHIPLFLAMALALGCQGRVDASLSTGPTGTPQPPAMETPETPVTPIDPVVDPVVEPPTPVAPVPGQDLRRRLSPGEVEATISDLFAELGVTPGVATLPLASPDVRYLFSNTAATGNLTATQVEGLVGWAEQVSASATQDLSGVLGCEPTPAFDDCAREFTMRLGRLTWRRPLTPQDVSIFETAYETIAAEDGPEAGVRTLWEIALGSPDFWYLSTQTQPDSDRLNSHALAAHLSYFVWGTAPDAALRALADQDELATPEALRAQVSSMLEDPRAREVITRFHRELLHVSSAFSLQKSPELYPTFTQETARDLEAEFSRYVEHIVLEGGSTEDLFSSRFGYVNARLEPLFGLEPMSSGDSDWLWRDLGPTRAGLFTRPLFLASTAGEGESALIHRGVAVMEKALCQTLTPPDDVSEEAVEIPVGASSGKLLGVENRASKANCSGCHNTIDPIGLAFEAFDAVGAHRTVYPDGVVLDTAGQLAQPSITYSDATELMESLASTQTVRFCYASKWVEWSTGHPLHSRERAEVARLAEIPTIRELLIEIAISPLFLERKEYTP